MHEKLTVLLRQAQQGLPAPVARQSVGEYLEAWLVQVAAHKVRPSTYRSYELYVRQHLVPALGRKRLAALSPADVRGFLHAKRTTGLAGATVKQMHGVLRSALSHAVREDLVPRNVAKLVQVPSPPRFKVRPLDVAEARQLLEGARGDRLYALWAVALGVGLRRGEALGLRWSDLDLAAGTLRVEQTLQRTPEGLVFLPPKSERSARAVQLPGICVVALREHSARQAAERLALGAAWHDSGLVFTSTIGTPVEPRNLTRAFGQLCRRAGVRPVRLHDLRHTCASLLLAQGVEPRVVMETLGHSQIGITMNLYTHVMPVLQQQAADGIDRALGG